MIPLVININGLVLPSFDLQILMQYWDIDPDQVTVNIGHEITLKKPDGSQISIPIDEQGQLHHQLSRVRRGLPFAGDGL